MSCGTYLIWFSRYNIPAHLNLGVIFVGYFVPLMLTDILHEYPDDLIDLYTAVICIGAFFYMVGLVIGFQYSIFDKLIKRPNFSYDGFFKFSNFKYNLILILIFGSLFVMALCWAYIGMVPMLAPDPLLAKFFKGQYHDSYSKVALPYRLSQTILIMIFPIVAALWALTRKKILLLACVLIMIFFSLALTRGLMLSGIITLLAVFAAKKRSHMAAFIMIYLFVFGVGSGIYYIYSAITEVKIFAYASDSTIWTIIASGSPDIPDQLGLLAAFENHGEFTLGRTFWGGLIPGQYYWNPSAWSLYILNNTDDISDVASGGLRIPVALWGYFSFGWLGVIIVPFLSGLIFGTSTRYIKKYMLSNNILRSVLVLSFYSIVLSFFGNFYAMSMYNIPAFLILFILIYRFSTRSRA